MNSEDSLYAELYDRRDELESKCAADPEMRGRTLRAGDLFLLKMPYPVPVSWCAVFSHSKDDSLWYCVPGDSLSLVAATDVTARALGLQSEFNFRCHCGLWVHAEDVDLGNRYARVDQMYVVSIRDKIAEIAKNPLGILNSEISLDPDYEDWIEELRRAVDSLLHSLHDAPNAPVRVIGPDSAIAAYGETLSLAADDSVETTDTDVPTLYETRKIYDSTTGRLQVSLYEDGISMEWIPKRSESTAPRVMHGSVSLDWFNQGELYCTRIVQWSGQSIELSLPDEVISVTKPKEF